MNIPSVEQVKLRADAPIGSQQMILLYLELFLVTVLQMMQRLMFFRAGGSRGRS